MPGGLASNAVEGKEILWLPWKLNDGLCNFPNQIQLNTKLYSHQPCQSFVPTNCLMYYSSLLRMGHFLNEGVLILPKAQLNLLEE